MLRLPVSSREFWRDLRSEIEEDRIDNGAATLAFYFLLAIFPAMIFLLSLLPYVPLQNLDTAVTDFLGQAMPPQAAVLVMQTVRKIVEEDRGSLLSFGLIGTLWAASTGIYAVMQQLNITYDVKESRSYIKCRLIALGLLFLFSLLIIGTFGLIVAGGELQDWLSHSLGWNKLLLAAFAALRWLLIIAMALLSFAVIYYFGPDVEQEFRFITPGSVAGTIVIIATTLLFNWYVANFSDYNATYGSLGAAIILMLWLYVMGLVLLLGSEVNALIEHYHPHGKEKGEKQKDSQSTQIAPAH